jgi:AAA ATPase domain
MGNGRRGESRVRSVETRLRCGMLTRMATRPEPVGSTLLGRERELAELEAWLDAAVAGHGRLVLVVGEAGIGKTRLAQEVAGRSSEATVVWGRCVDTEGAPPFWPWRQVLRALDAAEVPAADAVSPQTGSGSSTLLPARSSRPPVRSPCWSSSTTSTGPTSRRCSYCATSPTALPRRRSSCWPRCATLNRTPRSRRRCRT